MIDSFATLDCGHSRTLYNNVRSDPTGWQTWCYECGSSKTVTKVSPWPPDTGTTPTPDWREVEEMAHMLPAIEGEDEATLETVASLRTRLAEAEGLAGARGAVLAGHAEAVAKMERELVATRTRLAELDTEADAFASRAGLAETALREARTRLAEAEAALREILNLTMGVGRSVRFAGVAHRIARRYFESRARV